MSEKCCEVVLHDTLHAARFLLCITIYKTTHKRFFGFSKRSMIGKSIPNWLLNPGLVLLRRHVRTKSDSLCDEVDLINTNSSFARVRYQNGQETTISTKDLAPCPSSDVQPLSENKNFISISKRCFFSGKSRTGNHANNRKFLIASAYRTKV